MRTNRLTYTFACLLAAALTLLAFGAPGLPAASTSATFVAVADAYVDYSKPSNNFGTSTTLKVDGSPVVSTYLKFNLSGVGSPASAALRVYVTSNNDGPFEIRSVPNTLWNESTINASNAPVVGQIVASSGPVTAGNWYTFDVSDAITGDGVVSLALTTAGAKSTSIQSREAVNKPQIIVPAPAGPTSFVVTRAGSIYTAQSPSTGTTYSGTLKSVVETAVADLNRSGGGTVHFTSGLFELGDSHFELHDMVNITFEGEGMNATTITNFRSIADDTEIFDVSRATGGGVHDLAVNAGGPPRSTSDALDFDSGNNMTIERVKVLGSRARGIVFDGKDITGGIVRKAEGNFIHDCVIANIPSDGVELLAAHNNRVEGCTITNVGGIGIQMVKGSPTADQPNKKASGNIIVGNFIDEAGQDGINITSGDANQILGNTITNSSNLTSGRDGIRITSSDSITCDDNVVTGNTATDNQATKTQRYGLRIASALCNRTQISGNNFAGNLSGEILDQGTGTIYGDPPAPDTEDPTVPGNLTATAVSGTQVDLAWTHSTDNVGVTGYTVYRDGAVLTTVGSATSSYQDLTASPNTTYTYTVDAFDGATNHSAQSAPATATTPGAPPGPPVQTFSPSDDTQVNEASPTTNYGSQTTLRIDGSPLVHSYLKFTVTGLTSSITRATLRVYANSSSSTGYEAHGSADTSWTEGTLTFANQPAFGGIAGSSGAFSAGAYVDVDVTSLITGNGTFTLVMTGAGATAVSFASSESSNVPQLVVETTP